MQIRITDVERLNSLIIMAGYTKAAFGKAIELSSPMVVQITTGKRNPSPPVAKKIADALGVEFGDIFELVPRNADGKGA